MCFWWIAPLTLASCLISFWLPIPLFLILATWRLGAEIKGEQEFIKEYSKVLENINEEVRKSEIRLTEMRNSSPWKPQ